jgi:uncharacterized protein (TIGR02145 family)
LVTDSANWSNLSTPGYCWYTNNASSFKDTYGALYNWFTVDTRKLCPTGWHVPTDNEWIVLIDNLGGESAAGGKLKETGTINWNSPNVGANDSSGFIARPGGSRYSSSGFNNRGKYGFWWSLSESAIASATGRFLYYNSSDIKSFSDSKVAGYSVRCLSDNVSTIGITNTDEIYLYPNPTREKLYIKNIVYSNSILFIFNIQGEQILNKQKFNNSIDISNLKNGLYFVKILDSGKIRVAKFVKE